MTARTGETDMSDVAKIFDDPRTINSIWFEGENAGGYSIQKNLDGSTGKIVAYREHGQMDFVPYFAVFDHNGQIKARVPAQMVTVIYQEGES